MKTFAEMLPTATAEMREFVEAYDTAVNKYLSGTPDDGQPWPLEQMRATPPANEPVSVEGVVEIYHDVIVVINHVEINPGDRVRVVKIEETT